MGLSEAEEGDDPQEAEEKWGRVGDIRRECIPLRRGIGNECNE
jgi:hypothetical protein